MGIVLLMAVFIGATAVLLYGTFGARWWNVIMGSTASRTRHVHVDSERGPAPKVSPLDAKPISGGHGQSAGHGSTGLETSMMSEEDTARAKMSPQGQSGPLPSESHEGGGALMAGEEPGSPEQRTIDPAHGNGSKNGRSKGKPKGEGGGETNA